MNYFVFELWRDADGWAFNSVGVKNTFAEARALVKELTASPHTALLADSPVLRYQICNCKTGRSKYYRATKPPTNSDELPFRND